MILWQLVFSVLAAVVCGLLLGANAAISGFLGAIVSVIAGLVYAVLIARHSGYSAAGVLRTALRAEAAKIFVVVVSLWAVFSVFKGLQSVVFVGSFIIAVLISSMAVFVPEKLNK